MPVAGVQCVRGRVTFEECRRCMQDPLHPCGYTPDLLTHLLDDKEPPDTAFTPSRIVGCLRKPVLAGEEDTWRDVDNEWSFLRGHIIHGLAEQLDWPGGANIREVRFATLVDTKHGPQSFSAKPDLVVWNRGKDGNIHCVLVDYKTRDFGHELVEADESHQLQINLYAWILRRELAAYLGLPGVEVVLDELVIEYISFARPRRFTSLGTLQARGRRIPGTKPYEYETLDLAPIQVLEDARLERYVRKRIEAKIRAKEVLPPPLAGEAAKWCFRCPVRQACVMAG